MRNFLFALSLAASAATLTQSGAKVTLPYSPYNKPLVKFVNGFFTAYDREASLFSLFDREGRPVINGMWLRIPGIMKFEPRSVAVSTKSMAALTGSAYTEEGSLASAIVWVRADGKVARVVRTYPYAPFSLAFATDGSLWAVGRVRDTNFKDVPGHDIVRRYDGDGKLLQTLISRDSFPALPPREHPGRGAVLVAGEDRMGLLSVTGREYIEFSLSGEVLGRWRTQPVTRTHVWVDAMIAKDNSLYIQVGGENAESMMYRLDKSSGSLTKIPVNVKSYFYLAGNDGDAAVLGLGDTNYAWFSLSE